MNRKLIRGLGSVLGALLAWLPDGRAVTTCSSASVTGHTYYVSCSDYETIYACAKYIYDGSYSGTGEYISSPCAGYKNGTGIACNTPGNESWNDSQCKSYFGSEYVGNYWYTRPGASGTLYYFTGCRPGAYQAKEDSCSSASGGGNMSCGYTYPTSMSGWCQPCSGFKYEGTGFVTFTYTGYDNTSGIYSWDTEKPILTTGMQNCRGYAQTGASASDDTGTFNIEIPSGGCPYIV